MLDPTRAKVGGILKNCGLSPAANMEASVFMLPQIEVPGDIRKAVEFPTSIADEMAPGSEWLVETVELQIIDPKFQGADVEPSYYDPGSYVCIGIKYDDPVTTKHYTQISFMRWPGVAQGVIAGNLVAASKAQKDAVTTKYNSTLLSYLV